MAPAPPADSAPPRHVRAMEPSDGSPATSIVVTVVKSSSDCTFGFVRVSRSAASERASRGRAAVAALELLVAPTAPASITPSPACRAPYPRRPRPARGLRPPLRRPRAPGAGRGRAPLARSARRSPPTLSGPPRVPAAGAGRGGRREHEDDGEVHERAVGEVD